MPYLFTSESVSEGHPDKIADQISDALIDQFLAQDSESKVAIETLVTTGQVIVAGEVKSNAYVDLHKTIRGVIERIGYTKSEYQFDSVSCGILSAIHEQSADINQGVDKKKREEQGAGDQGMMFGYASKETDNYMPLPLELAHLLLRELATIRRENENGKKKNGMSYLRPDAKSQVTIEYDDNHKPIRIDAIVVSTQHDDFASEKEMAERIRKDVINVLIPRVKKHLPTHIQKLFNNKIQYHINPTGRFVIGGPHGDTGLTGRKIIVDTYGGKGAHGGGAFSGKDPSKVDRSAAYAARHMAKHLVAAGVCDEALVQVAYAIGVAEPVGLYINTYGTSKIKKTDGEIASVMRSLSGFNMRPFEIEKRFKLRTPIYEETASYGHMGREPQKKIKTYKINGKEKNVTVELFPWEKLDQISSVKKAFGLR